MIATIAHELQHAVEVIEDETVNDEKSLVALYRRIGQQSWQRVAIALGDRRPPSEPASWSGKSSPSVPVTTIARAGAAGRW